MKKILIPLIVAILLLGCDFDANQLERIEVSGPVVKTYQSFGSFSELMIAGPIDVVLDQRGHNDIEVETYESLMKLFRAEILDDVLILYVLDTTDTSNNHFNISGDFGKFSDKAMLSSSRIKWPDNKKLLNVHISVSDLDKIQIVGECEMNFADRFKADELSLEVAGALHFDADLDVNLLEVDLAGAGNLKLTGRADVFDLECAGAGTIKAYDLEAQDVKMDIAGVCNAQVNVAESIDVEIAGMGTVKYKGNPGSVSFEKAGLGSLKQAEPEETTKTDI